MQILVRDWKDNPNALRISYGEGEFKEECTIIFDAFKEKDAFKRIIEKVNNRQKRTVCPYLVIVGRSAKIKKLNSSKKYYNTFIKVMDVVMQFEASQEITQAEVRQRLGLTEVTHGDLLREFLDLLVCWGLLLKIKFKTGKGGHVYKRTNFVVTDKDRFCPHSSPDGCICPKVLFRRIDVDDAEIGIFKQRSEIQMMKDKGIL